MISSKITNDVSFEFFHFSGGRCFPRVSSVCQLTIVRTCKRYVSFVSLFSVELRQLWPFPPPPPRLHPLFLLWAPVSSFELLNFRLWTEPWPWDLGGRYERGRDSPSREFNWTIFPLRGLRCIITLSLVEAEKNYDDKRNFLIEMKKDRRKKKR